MGVLSFDDLTDTEAACVRAVYGRRRYEPDPCCTRVLGDEPHAEDWGPGKHGLIISSTLPRKRRDRGGYQLWSTGPCGAL